MKVLPLSCGDWSFPLLPHEFAVDLIARLGFEGIDLMLRGNASHVRPEHVADDVPGWAARLDERIRGRGLEIADVFWIPWTDFETMTPNHPDRAERERSTEVFRRMLDLSARLGAPGMSTIPGIDWPHETHEESLERAAKHFSLWVAEAAAAGLTLSVEPHVGSVCATPADVEWLCELAPDLRLTLDYTHFVSQGFSEAETEPLVRHVRHFHTRGAVEGRLQAPLKESTIDYERAVDVLREAGYEGYISVEYLWVDWERLNEVDVLSETVMMRDLLRAKFAGEPWRYPSPSD